MTQKLNFSLSHILQNRLKQGTGEWVHRSNLEDGTGNVASSAPKLASGLDGLMGGSYNGERFGCARPISSPLDPHQRLRHYSGS